MSKKPLTNYQPCPDCLNRLEAEREKFGEQSFASGWCPHRRIFLAWSLGDLVLRPCETAAEAQRHARVAHAMIRQSISDYEQHLAEQLGESGRPN